MGSKKIVLITGASGLIGHGLLHVLKDSKEYIVVSIYRNNKPLIGADNFIFIRADLTKKEGWEELNRISPAILIHCAAIIPTSSVNSSQQDVKRLNLVMDNFTISYALKKKSKFIYLSSAGVYGYKIESECDENSPLYPQGDYFVGKAETEKNILSLNSTLKAYIFRISSPYGPWQRNKTVIMIFINNALCNKPLLYYGTGLRTQDFIHVKDVAVACMNSITSENYGVYNIASGQPISMKKLAVLIKKVAGSGSEIRSANIDDPQENFRPKFSIKKANEFLRWHPHYTLVNGLNELVQSLRLKNNQ